MKIENEKRKRKFPLICCLMISVSVFFTACDTDVPRDGGIANEGNNAGVTTASTEQVNPPSAIAAGKPEWVYVPERIEIRDERADYDAMRLIGDTVCYVSMNGESEDIHIAYMDSRYLRISLFTDRGSFPPHKKHSTKSLTVPFPVVIG